MRKLWWQNFNQLKRSFISKLIVFYLLRYLLKIVVHFGSFLNQFFCIRNYNISIIFNSLYHTNSFKINNIWKGTFHTTTVNDMFWQNKESQPFSYLCSGAGVASASRWVLKELTLSTVGGQFGPPSTPTAAELVVEGCSTEKEDATHLGK